MTEATTDATLTLATLRAGQRLRGLAPGQTVTLIAIDPIDAELFEVFYRDDAGRSGARFQLFMSLLDRDRFEGQYRQGVYRTDTHGLMRHMVKEDLLTFEGKPLFPERKAYTVEYELSAAERDLYELVTDYVRTEMGRAERIAQAGERASADGRFDAALVAAGVRLRRG